jgi:FKBP-type peptidyl-prolyl cis-trans isomerase FkpA
MTRLQPTIVVAVALLASCDAQFPQGPVQELVVVDERLGDGATAEAGRVVVVHYTGWLYDADADDRRGERFDSSHARGRPFEFQLGAARVIRGWDEGLVGMRVGGVRTLYIPPEDAYGASGVATVPPDSTLVFEVELLEVHE